MGLKSYPSLGQGLELFIRSIPALPYIRRDHYAEERQADAMDRLCCDCGGQQVTLQRQNG
jgi:hypothetical protein